VTVSELIRMEQELNGAGSSSKCLMVKLFGKGMVVVPEMLVTVLMLRLQERQRSLNLRQSLISRRI
jgi:hypothetical protein